MSYSAYFLLHTFAFGFSIAALTLPTWLKSTSPIFNATTSFGLFKTCVYKGNFETCMEYPSQECSLWEGLKNQPSSLEICQQWLLTRYLMIIAVTLGGLAWLSWLASLNCRLRSKVFPICLWCTSFHGKASPFFFCSYYFYFCLVFLQYCCVSFSLLHLIISFCCFYSDSPFASLIFLFDLNL